MITATCLGSRVKSSFSHRKASSAVIAPSGCDEATRRFLFSLLLNTKVLRTLSLCAIKLSHAAKGAQRFSFSVSHQSIHVSTAGQFSMKQLAERRVSHDQRKHAHSHR